MQLAFKMASSLVEYLSARLDKVSPSWKTMAMYPAGGIHSWVGGTVGGSVFRTPPVVCTEGGVPLTIATTGMAVIVWVIAAGKESACPFSAKESRMLPSNNTLESTAISEPEMRRRQPLTRLYSNPFRSFVLARPAREC
jgi:hypothetical protein